MQLILNKKIREKYHDELPKTKKIIGNILKISIPAALETLFVGLIGLIDTIMVGRLGTAALASVSLTQQPYFISLAACMGLGAGVTAIVSRKKGLNDPEGAKKSLRQAILLGTIVSLVLCALCLLLARPFLLITGAESDTIDFSTSYFRIITSVLVFTYIRMIICAGFRAIGDTKITLLTNIVANLVNICLNYCLIFGNFGFPELGVAGAAVASAISNLVAFVIAVLLFRFKKSFIQTKFTDNWRYDKEVSKQVVHISSSAFIEQLFMRIGFYIIALIINHLGTESVATNAIIAGIISLAFNITDGFAIGASALVGRSLGEKRNALAFAYGRLSQMLSFCLGTGMITLILIFSDQLGSLFSDEPLIIAEASKILVFAAFVVFPQSLQWVTTNILRGAGDVRFTSRTAIISTVFVRPIAAFILCYPLGLGVLGSWLGMFIDQVLRFSINNYRFCNLRWIGIRID